MNTIWMIHCACGAGLATSLIMQLNAEKALLKLNRNDIKVTHSAAESIREEGADIFVVGKDLAYRFKHFPRVIVINQIMSFDEIYEKLKIALSQTSDTFWIEDNL